MSWQLARPKLCPCTSKGQILPPSPWGLPATCEQEGREEDESQERLWSPCSPQSSSTTLLAPPPPRMAPGPQIPLAQGDSRTSPLCPHGDARHRELRGKTAKVTHPLPMSNHSLPLPGAGSISGTAGAGPCHTLGTRVKDGFGRTCWGHGRCHCEQLSGCSTVSGTEAWPHVPGSCQLGAREMNMAAFILVPHGSTAFGLHPDQHGPTGQK